MAQLEIIVVEARNLKQKNLFKKNNSFLRIYLNNQKYQTKTIKNSNDPEWQEIFFFNHMEGQDILYVHIYTKSLLENEKIGFLKINLQPLYKKGHIDNWFHIPAKLGLACCGQIHLKINYKHHDM